MADILLPRAKRTQHADFFRAFHHGNICDNAYHHRRNNQRNGGEGNQHVRYRVQHRLHHAHHRAHRIGISNFLRRIVRIVPRVKIRNHLCFRIEIGRINGNLAHFVAAAQRLQRLIYGNVEIFIFQKRVQHARFRGTYSCGREIIFHDFARNIRIVQMLRRRTVNIRFHPRQLLPVGRARVV